MNRCTDCGFYDLSKEERTKLVRKMDHVIQQDLQSENSESIRRYASDCDTHIRKNAYLRIGRIYRDDRDMRARILITLVNLFRDPDEKVRQTVVRALGEIGRTEADNIMGMLEIALGDTHHSVRNAVVGALKRMGEKNPKPTLDFARRFLHHSDPNIRREIVHGIELRGRTHPKEVLPLLKAVQNDSDRKVRKTVIHVLGPISYKKGCLEEVVSALKEWENGDLVDAALKEIRDVHGRYEQFSDRSQKEAMEYVEQQFKR